MDKMCNAAGEDVIGFEERISFDGIRAAAALVILGPMSRFPGLAGAIYPPPASTLPPPRPGDCVPA